MIVTIIISSIAVLLAYIAQYKKFKYCFELSIALLTVFIAIRYDWGNDYIGYLETFKRIGGYVSLEEAFKYERIEIGWIFLNRIFRPIGFFGFTIIVTVFEYFVLYRLIKKYVPKEWYWLSIFIFTFNSALMLVTSSMMRQFLAMTIILIAIEFIIRRKWYISLLIISLASLFHTSALVILPFSFIGYFNLKINRNLAFGVFGVYLISFFTADVFLKDHITILTDFELFEKYDVYLNGDKLTEDGIGIGTVFNMFVILLMLLYYRRQHPIVRILFILLFLSNFFYLFGSVAPFIGRLGYYFSILMIVVYPRMLRSMRNDFWLYPFLVGCLLILIVGFFQFFDPTGIWYKSFYNYQTIFSALNWM